MEDLVCCFCQHCFSNKHNLKVHQATAKYCMKLHESHDNKGNGHECEHCHKRFTSRQTLLYHLRVCRKALTYELKAQHAQHIKELESKHQAQLDTLKNRIRALETRIRNPPPFQFV